MGMEDKERKGNKVDYKSKLTFGNSIRLVPMTNSKTIGIENYFCFEEIVPLSKSKLRNTLGSTRFMFISYKGDLHGSNMLTDFFESIVCLYLRLIDVARLIKKIVKEHKATSKICQRQISYYCRR